MVSAFTFFSKDPVAGRLSDRCSRAISNGADATIRRVRRVALWPVLGPTRWPALAALMLAGLAALELQTSWLQSQLLTEAARRISYSIGLGPSESVRFPASGPYAISDRPAAP